MLSHLTLAPGVRTEVEVRRILSYVAGLGSAFLVILVLEAAVHFVFPQPPGTDVHDPASVDRMMHAMPALAFVALLVAYVIGSIVGGLTAALVSDGITIVPSIVTGCALTIAGAANVFTIYHPAWFRVASLITYLPFSYLGCLAARGRRA
jgi:hypothetical protein